MKEKLSDYVKGLKQGRAVCEVVGQCTEWHAFELQMNVYIHVSPHVFTVIELCFTQPTCEVRNVCA